MAALAGTFDTKRKNGALIAYPLAAGARVFQGALVAVTSATGLAAPAADAAGVVCVGVAYESADNTGGAAGALAVRVQKTGLYRYPKTGAAQTDVGKTARVVDDNTITTAATANGVVAGVVGALVDSGTLAILIDGRVG